MKRLPITHYLPALYFERLNNRTVEVLPIAYYLKIAIALFFCLLLNGVWFVPKGHAGIFSGSSLAGLVTMKKMAAESVSYDVAMNSDRPMVLEFYANWCTTCQGMAPTMEKLEAEYGETVNLVMFDIDDPQWVKIIQEYRVTGVPQFTFLDRDRQIQNTLVGKVPRSIMAENFAALSK